MTFSMKSVRAVLLDITGVLYDSYQENKAIAVPGSVEAVCRLRDSGIPFRFVTNESTCSRQMLVDKLRGIGFDLSVDEVFSPAPAVLRFLKEKGLRPFLVVHPDILKDFEEVSVLQEPNCVVLGDAAEHFSYANMNKAFQILIHEEVPQLLAMGKGKYYKHGKELTLDLGGYVAALEYACDVKAQIYGKPSKEYFLAAVADMGLDPAENEVLMIGDDIENDVGGAQQSGLRGALVRTGKFRCKDEHHPLIKPDIIFDNLAAGVEFLLKSVERK